MEKKEINWEERRFYAAALILAGLAANYQHPFTPNTCYIKSVINLADKLVQALSAPSDQSICADLYQRE